MWNSLNRALWLLPVLGVSSYAQNDTANETTKRAVIAASAEVSKALASRDEHTLRKWFAHDFVLIHGSGARESLAAFILRLLKGQDPFSAGIAGKYDIDVKLIGNDGAVLTETVNTQGRWAIAMAHKHFGIPKELGRMARVLTVSVRTAPSLPISSTSMSYFPAMPAEKGS